MGRLWGACFTLPTGTALDSESVGWKLQFPYSQRSSHVLIEGPDKVQSQPESSVVLFFAPCTCEPKFCFSLSVTLSWGSWGPAQTASLSGRPHVCFFASRIRGTTRSLPDTGGLLSLPQGRGTGPATQGLGEREARLGLSTWPLSELCSTAASSSLSLCSYKVLLG